MQSKQFKTPILIIGFNRPDLVKAVFARTLEVNPRVIHFAVDGPRPNNPNDVEKNQAVKDMAETMCRGKCKLVTHYQKDNNGCKNGPYLAIDWFFSCVERGIILEDDCVPNVTFFRYCEDLLSKYEIDERIASISGSNFQLGKRRTKDSYYFSRFSHTQGWATWRRVWVKYDVAIKGWPELKSGGWLYDILGDRKSVRYWSLIFDRVYSGKLDSAWDYQWSFMCWSNSMLSILPNQNLISNVGYCSHDATHTKGKSKFAQLATLPMIFPLEHPVFMIRDSKADSRTQKNNYVLWKELGVIALAKLGLR